MVSDAKQALIFGSCTGKTEYIADLIVEKLKPEIDLEIIEITKVEAEDLAKYQFLVCGIPTWDIGELEYGWADVYEKMDNVSLNGLTIAMFGLGDQDGYPDTYQDAMGLLYEKFIECGARGNVGFTSTEGHDYEDSRAVFEATPDQFCGLALDEDNQEDQSEDRIAAWAEQLKKEIANLEPKLELPAGT